MKASFLEIQVTSKGFSLKSPEGQIEEFHQEYLRQNHLKLPLVLGKDLENFVRKKLSTLEYENSDYEGLANNLDEDRGSALAKGLNFIFKDRKFLSLVGQITGKKVVDFWGRVYRIKPPNRGFAWHSDNRDSRVAALTVNLTNKSYEGGTLFLKNLDNNRQIYRLPNQDFGNAFLFGIGSNWHHKVSRVSGTQPKIAFSGWFFSKPHCS